MVDNAVILGFAFANFTSNYNNPVAQALADYIPAFVKPAGYFTVAAAYNYTMIVGSGYKSAASAIEISAAATSNYFTFAEQTLNEVVAPAHYSVDNITADSSI